MYWVATEIDPPAVAELLTDAMPGVCWSVSQDHLGYVFLHGFFPDGDWQFRHIKMQEHPNLQLLTVGISMNFKWMEGVQK